MKKEKQNKKIVFYGPDRRISGHNGGKNFKIMLYHYFGTWYRDE